MVVRLLHDPSIVYLTGHAMRILCFLEELAIAEDCWKISCTQFVLFQKTSLLLYSKLQSLLRIDSVNGMHKVNTGTKDILQGYASGFYCICQTCLQRCHILDHGSLQLESQTVSKFPRSTWLFEHQSSCSSQQMLKCLFTKILKTLALYFRIR